MEQFTNTACADPLVALPGAYKVFNKTVEDTRPLRYFQCGKLTAADRLL